MPRYESAAGKRFWEIVVDGNRIITRTGQIGSDGRAAEPTVLAGHADALKEAEKRAADKVKKGFERVDDDLAGTVHARDAELANAALAASGDPDAELDDHGLDAYLVYGDWLQTQGDKRGELVALQHQLARNPEDARLQKAEDSLRKQLTPARLDKMLKKRRSAGKAESGYCELWWRLGFIHKARIGRSSDRPPYTVRELVAQLLRHPSAELLQVLIIGALGPGEYDYSAVLSEIALAAPGALRQLFVADNTPEHAELAVTSLGDVSVLYGRLPRLERLHLRAGAMTLGDVQLPGLRELAVSMSRIDEDVLQSIAAARWPSLVSLALHAGRTVLPAAGISAMAAAASMGALRHLAIRDSDDTGGIVQVLARAPLLQGLASLDLSGGSLGDADAAALLAHAHAFEHLGCLNVEGNMLSPAAVASVSKLCAEIRGGGQRPPLADRVSVTNQQIADFSPDPQSMTAARKIAKRGVWPDLGQEGALLWGRCQGSELYDVYVDTDGMESGCTCPSMKYPCKHAIALLMLSTQNQTIPAEPPPPGFVGSCEASRRYDSFWE